MSSLTTFTRRLNLISLASLACLSLGTGAVHAAADDQPIKADTTDPLRVIIKGLASSAAEQESRPAGARPPIDGNQITATRKTTVLQLDAQPTVVDNNLRSLFNGLPGINLGEQQNPVQLNASYRGIGNPQEAEYILSLYDGIPIATDWIAVPTTYVLPIPQGVQSIQLTRGGSSLLYGPQPGPVLNYIGKRPPAGRDFFGTTEQVGGSDALFSSFNAVGGRWGALDLLADIAWRKSDGQRNNGDYKLRSTDLRAGYNLGRGNRLEAALHDYSVDSGLAGFQTIQQFNTDPRLTVTPYDREWIDRTVGDVRGIFELSDNLTLDAKLWHGKQRLSTRAVVASSTALTDQRYDFTGIDARFKQRLSATDWLTFGYTGYSSRSPWRQRNGSDKLVDRDDASSGTLTYSDDRHTRYNAVFAEGLWIVSGIQLVPSVRVENVEVSADQSIATSHPTNLVHRTVRKSVPLFGLGIGKEFGDGHTVFANVSQAYRPVRYQDFASPNGNFGAANEPTPTRYVTYEAGIRGETSDSLFYSASLFQVNTKNKIESQGNGIPGQTINVNSGDVRSRGVEMEVNLDLLRLLSGKQAGGQQLRLSVNASLLDAKITDSKSLVFAGGPTLAGNTPAYAPHYLVKAGLSYLASNRLKVSLQAVSTGTQYWADNNQPRTSGTLVVTPAQIPRSTVYDLSADYSVTPSFRVIASVANLTDKLYYSRVFFVNGGIEPARRRTAQLGAALDF